MSSVSAAFVDLGWTPHERAIWNSPEGDKWEYTAGVVFRILGGLGHCALGSDWAKASNHVDGQGLAHGYVRIRETASSLGAEGET